MSSPRSATQNNDIRGGVPPLTQWDIGQTSVEGSGWLGRGFSVQISQPRPGAEYFLGRRQPDRLSAEDLWEERLRSFVAALISGREVQQGVLGRQLGRGLLGESSPTIYHQADWADDDRFTRRLNVLFEDAPIEDGYGHPAQELILAALGDPGKQRLLLRLLSDAGYRHRSALFRCLGRLPGAIVSWAFGAAEYALASEDIEIRDAAIQALELWATPEAIHLLREHQERVPWLRDYVRRVLEDFAA